MAKKLCILHGNCQGDVLAILLSHSDQFSKYFEIRRIVNYLEERPSEQDLAKCSLFLYQYLSPRWGANATDKLLSLLEPSCETLCFPNMFFKGYWPFWYKAEDKIEFADSLLEKLIELQLPLQGLMSIYKKCPAFLAGDFEQSVNSTLNIEREKEQKSTIKYVHLIEENWRQRQMFLTINHPSMELLVYVANSVLKKLGFSELASSLTNRIAHPYNEFWLPIHPQVGKALSLPFVFPERKYNCFANQLNHEEYTKFYLGCRMNKIRQLTAALAQIDHKSTKSS